MPLPTAGTTQVADSDLPPAGIQARFVIKDAVYRPDAKYGPDIQLYLEMIDEKYFGIPARFWVTLLQPRLALVRDLRQKGVTDKAIAETLKEKAAKYPESGYDFKKRIDEPQDPRISRGGNTYKVLTAAVDGDRKRAEEVLHELDEWAELAEFFIDKCFVATTRLKTKKDPDTGETRTFVNIDGQEDIFADVAEKLEAATDADYEELPDYDDATSPPAPF